MSEDRNTEIDLEAFRTAKEIRNLEIGLFWQRSNHFLVLSTAIAAGFFTINNSNSTHALLLAMFGLVVAVLWFAVNLGSKFWQSRWEYRLWEAEKHLRSDLNLFSAPWEIVKEDVRKAFEFRPRGRVHRLYTNLVMLKPSVTMMMTMLSASFALFWIALFAATLWKLLTQ